MNKIYSHFWEEIQLLMIADPEIYLQKYMAWHQYAIVNVKKLCIFFWKHPIYEPDKWNDGGVIQKKNNCYNYACNVQTNTYAQPGKASGNMYSQFTCPEVSDGAKSDGLIHVAVGSCKLCCHKVALFVWPGWDYHWYRQDGSGMWSHKPGETEATNLDNSGNPITDPLTADRGGYTDFCGFFCVCSGKFNII